MEKISNKIRVENIKQAIIRTPVILIVVVYLIIIALFVPSFFTLSNIKNFFIQSSDMAIFSCALMFVLLNGSIDFSSASVIGLGSVIAAMIMNNNDGFLKGSALAVPIGILSILVISLFINLLNGLAITRLKIPSFIATMSSNMIFMGIALYISQSKTIGNLPSVFTAIGSNDLVGIPIPVIIASLTVIITGFILSRTTFGKKVYAVGTNHKAAHISGVPVKKTIVNLFLINGILVSLGTIVFSARIGTGIAGLGSNRVLDFVTAVVIGGTSVYGGAGTVTGTVFGAMFIILINNSLNMLGSSWYVIMMIKGLIIIGMAIADSRRVLREKKN